MKEHSMHVIHTHDNNVIHLAIIYYDDASIDYIGLKRNLVFSAAATP